MTNFSHRLALPFLIAGQAQKEVWHNEALMQLDYLVQPVIVAHAPAAIPTNPQTGQCWIVGASPSGTWAGKAAHLACWTNQGWRFAEPFEGMICWSLADSMIWRFDGNNWSKGIITGQRLMLGGDQLLTIRQPGINAPSGGTTIDAEARVAIASLLTTLRTHGLIAA